MEDNAISGGPVSTLHDFHAKKLPYSRVQFEFYLIDNEYSILEKNSQISNLSFKHVLFARELRDSLL